MKKKLHELIVCPKCLGALRHEAKVGELVCENCRLGYPLQDGIPLLTEAGARKIGGG